MSVSAPANPPRGRVADRRSSAPKGVAPREEARVGAKSARTREPRAASREPRAASPKRGRGAAASGSRKPRSSPAWRRSQVRGQEPHRGPHHGLHRPRGPDAVPTAPRDAWQARECRGLVSRTASRTCVIHVSYKRIRTHLCRYGKVIEHYCTLYYAYRKQSKIPEACFPWSMLVPRASGAVRLHVCAYTCSRRAYIEVRHAHACQDVRFGIPEPGTPRARSVPDEALRQIASCPTPMSNLGGEEVSPQVLAWLCVHWFLGPSWWCYLAMFWVAGAIFVPMSQVHGGTQRPSPISDLARRGSGGVQVLSRGMPLRVVCEWGESMTCNRVAKNCTLPLIQIPRIQVRKTHEASPPRQAGSDSNKLNVCKQPNICRVNFRPLLILSLRL